jgi:hypothetical protein
LFASGFVGAEAERLPMTAGAGFKNVRIVPGK